MWVCGVGMCTVLSDVATNGIQHSQHEAAKAPAGQLGQSAPASTSLALADPELTITAAGRADRGPARAASGKISVLSAPARHTASITYMHLFCNMVWVRVYVGWAGLGRAPLLGISQGSARPRATLH